jgi:dihydroflavonol-4-reductase
MSTTLITGATGFIGSHVTRQLLGRGESVRVLVRSPERLADVGVDQSAPGLEVMVGDLLAPGTIAPALRGISRIHHIAGSISLREADRERMRAVNYVATRNLLDAASAAEVARIVYLASIFALGGGAGQTVTEDATWQLSGLDVPYLQAKREAELMVRERAREGMPIVFAYPCFCYGPGDVYESSSDLLAGFLRGSLPAYVNGGQNAMDVRDAAAGLILAMDSGRDGERYLLGGENITAMQLFGLLTYITGRPGPRIRLAPSVARAAAAAAERVLADPPLTRQMALMVARNWYYDDSRARTELGYTSRPLEQTLRDAVGWHLARGIG